MVTGPLVLGIETSGDETGVWPGARALEPPADIGGVQRGRRPPGTAAWPEVASRAHLEAMVPAVERALATAGVSLAEVDAIAVTAGPGLGALLVGVCVAKAYALALGKPLYGVNHLAAHIAVDQLEHGTLRRSRCSSPADDHCCSSEALPETSCAARRNHHDAAGRGL